MKEREILVSFVLLLSVGLWNRCRAEVQALFQTFRAETRISLLGFFSSSAFLNCLLRFLNFSDSTTSLFCFAQGNELTN